MKTIFLLPFSHLISSRQYISSSKLTTYVFTEEKNVPMVHFLLNLIQKVMYTIISIGVVI